MGDGTARAGHGDSQRTATHPAFPHTELGRYRYTGQQPKFHDLPVSPETQASAEIVTEELRLIERFFLSIKWIVKEGF